MAANGVENQLQRTPANAVEVCRTLLDAGAEVDATAETYGGGPQQTTLNLLVSSVWPHQAGVQEALVEVLFDAGAAIDGVRGDGSPLRTALQFGYIASAEALHRHGARVDTLELAAGLGLVEVLGEMFDGDGSVLPHAISERGISGHPLQDAFRLACVNGRVEAASFLLDRGVEIDARLAQGGTALHDAILWSHPDVVDLLLVRGADPSVRHRRWNATALDFASYNGKEACVRRLLDSNAGDLEEALVSAAGQGHRGIAEILLVAGAPPERALARASEVGDDEMMTLLGG